MPIFLKYFVKTIKIITISSIFSKFHQKFRVQHALDAEIAAAEAALDKELKKNLIFFFEKTSKINEILLKTMKIESISMIFSKFRQNFIDFVNCQILILY